MQVFKERMATRGGHPLPLMYYLNPAVTTAEKSPPVDVFTTKIGGQSFYESLRSDDGFPTLNAFLLGGVDVNVRDTNGASPLHIAVARPASAEVNEDDDHDDELLAAAGPNDLIISFLIDNGCEINARNATGETPLMIAAATQNISALRIMLLRGADTSLSDDMGNTVIHYAARYPSVLQTLYAWVDDLPAQVARENLLHVVCRQGGGAEFAALFLIEQMGIDVNAREGGGGGLSTGGNHYDNEGAGVEDKGSAGTVQCRDSGLVSRVTVREGSTPLHCAVLAGDPGLVRLLLLKGADVERPDAAGVTPIELAVDCCVLSSSSFPSSTPSLSFFVRLYNFLLPNRNNRSGAKSRDPQKVYAMLDAYREEESPTKREMNLKREGAADTSLREMNSLRDGVLFCAAATIPHVLLALCAMKSWSFWDLVVIATLALLSCAGFTVKDNKRSNARPLRSAGFFVGYTTMLLACSIVEKYSMGPKYAASLYCIVLCGIGSVVCALLVLCKDPGKVESTSGQRLGIYKTILHTKGILSEDIRKSIDLFCMVKKPTRAQRCRQLGRVVLRYDHYSTWLASSIGGGNHRPYVAFLIMYTCLLGVCCWSTHCSSPDPNDMGVSATGSTSGRIVDVYIWFVLPIAFLFSLYVLLLQLWYISRGVTSFDVAHPSRSPWCFQLGSRTYSLFDFGFVENMRRFFFLGENLLAISYRMPAMSARLQQKAKRYHALQLSPCQEGHCHSHTEHVGQSHTKNGAPHQEQYHYDGQQKTNSHMIHAESDNVNRGDGSHFVTSVVAAPSSASAPHPPTDATTIPVPTSSGSTAPLNFESVVGSLFQLMVQQDYADVSDVASVDELRANMLPGEWPEAVAKAQSMFSFFKNTMGASS